jgi:polysaccharide export outer membrane protein
MAAAMLAAAGPAPYRIQTGDVIEVHYRLTPEFNATAAVQPDGTVILPLVGRTALAGMDAEQAAAAVRARAGERLRDPEVTLIVKEFTKPTYTVAGEVAKPGLFDLRGEITLMRALANAGWFKESSKHSQVLLVRRADAEWGEARIIDVRRDVNRRDFAEDPVIQPGDLIVIPQNTLSKLDRYFRWSAFANLGFLLR